MRLEDCLSRDCTNERPQLGTNRSVEGGFRQPMMSPEEGGAERESASHAAGTTKEAKESPGVEDLEERVRSSRRHRRNSLHHTQMLESQMKTVKGELVGTLDHLQELRNKLRRSQQKAEERTAAMEKLAAGLR